MRAYGVSGSIHDYELDHLIPLELGGCPNCESDLWPEARNVFPGANEKDEVETCSKGREGNMSMKTSETALCLSFNVFVVGYRPVTANQNPSKFPITAGDVIRTIGASHSDGRLTVPAMFELPEASARNVLVKKSFPLVELAGS